ncbi:Putative phosphatase YwpJ [Jeotgalicoccus saudimassiliensis]|uniref:Putative phosphatase YwpJ n=1 Tax=Jeotgalicoccus saudimassiliensis TaxID=1461582 RepID=A0A078MA92_9STAP|nr:Cof-type HAD-IIB family hydrolase [Jeotgalicoccus saudimassiliensis]CEA03225.1 Putative phosphatase YwpJ [Jeotgalicoccus saudimassiliensis]
MKAIALDLDGTVLNNAGEFPDSLRDTLQAVHDKGIKIIIATGRSLPMIHKKVPHDVPVDGYVGASGMTVHHGDTLLSRTAFTEEQVDFVLSQVREHEIHYEMTTSEHGGPYTFKEDRAYAEKDLTQTPDATVLEYENIGTAKTLNSTEQWVDTLDINRSDIIKFYFFSNSKEKIDNWAALLQEKFTTDAGYQIYRTSDHNSEIMVYGTDKGTGLVTLLEEMNLSIDDVHAFGDSMNDIPMFKIAGKATAMANGKEDVKAIADDVTEFSCDEDGLEQYLKTHYL